MLEVGLYHKLTAARDTSVGVFLVDQDGEEVLLPRKYVPRELETGEDLEVFVYRDSKGRLISTTLKPFAQRNEFAFLRVKQLSQHGAFLDWGLEKEILVPFSHMKKPMEAGQSYVVYLYLDQVTDRVVASARVEAFTSREGVYVQAGEKVRILVYEESELGYKAIINHRYIGLLYHNEIFQPLAVGDQLDAWVKKIRPDEKIDLVLTQPGHESIEPQAAKILKKLQATSFLPLHDKSEPEAIKAAFGMSKKAFKRAIGSLYKQKLIRIESDGIHLVEG
ncbi:MAG: S1-like domain-containing RNA-binding protein [Bacteroidota bacterium]